MCYNTREEAIDAAKKEVEDVHWGFIDFEGNNCDDENNCSGWDGESRRCSCGNRRVSWYTYQNEKGLWTAEAYAN